MNKSKLVEIFKQHQPRTPMTEDESRAFINIYMSQDPNFSCDINDIHKNSELYNHFQPVINGFQFKIFLKRLEYHTTLKMSLGALIVLGQMMESPGKAVMLAFYLYYKVPENTLITLDEIGNVFPMGFFSNEQLNTIWDAQKVGIEEREGFSCIGAPDNMIDYLETWKD